MRPTRLFGITHGDIEFPVLTKVYVPPIVTRAGGQVIQYHRLCGPLPVHSGQSDDPIARRSRGRVIDVHEAVLRKGRIERNPEQPLLTAGLEAADLIKRRGAHLPPGVDDADTPGPEFVVKESSVRSERHGDREI